MPGVKQLSGPACNPSVYAFCFYVIPGNAGPYVESSTSPSYTIYPYSWITKAKTGKIDKKFDDYFYPDPGNPTYQYILFSGKTPKKPGKVKFNDYYCVSTSPSYCGPGVYSFILGIAITT